MDSVMDSFGLENKCELCNKYFSQKSSRNRHIKEQHLNPKLYHCEQCKTRFSKKYNLQVHMEKVHSKNRKQIKCSSCNCVFSKSTSLKKHLKDCQGCLKSKSALNIFSERGDETDAQSLAESVLKELKLLQQDLQTLKNPMPQCFENDQELTNNEKSTLQVTTVKDNLYPLGRFNLIKAQSIIRADGLKYFICDFCSKEFRKKYNFLRHRRIHTKIRPFVCVLCKEKFPTTTRLKAHCSIHKFNEKFGLFHKLYKCPKCNEGFCAIQQLDKHISSSSGCKIAFKCPNCFKFFRSLKTLLRHKHSEKDNELEMLKTLLPEPLWMGDEFSSSNKNKSCECNFCGMKVEEKTSLKHHVKRHENLFRNQCSKCRKSFATKPALKIHIKIHRSAKTFKCEFCNNCFNTAQSCRRHMETHLKQLLQCNEEKKDNLALFPTFIENEENGPTETTSISFIKGRKNIKEKTTAYKNLKYKCSECDKSFYYKSWLKKHFKYKHTTEQPFKCSCCLREFRTKQSLESHSLVHSTERLKLTCQVCGRQYASSKSLKLHLRIHTQDKPFSCKKCNLSFRTSGHIIQHYKQHD